MKKRIFVWVLMFHDGAPTVLQYQTVLPDCNICSPLLCPTLPQCTIRLIDFGLARLMPASNELLQTPAEHRPARLVAWIGCSDARCCSFQPNIPLACGLMPFLLHPWAVPEGGSGALSAAVGITEHCPPPPQWHVTGGDLNIPRSPLPPALRSRNLHRSTREEEWSTSLSKILPPVGGSAAAMAVLRRIPSALRGGVPPSRSARSRRVSEALQDHHFHQLMVLGGNDDGGSDDGLPTFASPYDGPPSRYGSSHVTGSFSPRDGTSPATSFHIASSSFTVTSPRKAAMLVSALRAASQRHIPSFGAAAAVSFAGSLPPSEPSSEAALGTRPSTVSSTKAEALTTPASSAASSMSRNPPPSHPLPSMAPNPEAPPSPLRPSALPAAVTTRATASQSPRPPPVLLPAAVTLPDDEPSNREGGDGVDIAVAVGVMPSQAAAGDSSNHKSPIPRMSHVLHKMTGKTGSLMYMAPEVFRGDKYNLKV